jgi:hypothetical protein
VEAMKAVQEVLERTSAAAADFGVDETMVDEFTARVNERGWLEGKGFTAVALQLSLVRVAEAHRTECAGGECRTCAQLRSGLAVALAAVRLIQNEELDRRFKATPSAQ